MKKLIIIAAISMLAVGCMRKSEEAVNLKIDTASMLRGRSVDAKVTINNTEKAEQIKGG